MDHDVDVLKKVLNSELFLGRYPMIRRVWVDRRGDNVDIVLNVKEPADEYWPLRSEINSYIHSIKTMVDVKSRLRIYP